VRDARGHRVRRDVLRRGRPAGEGRLEVGEQAPGRRVGVVEHEPGDRAVEQRGGLHDRRRLPGPGGRRHEHERVARQQVRHQTADSGASGEAVAERRHRELALDHGRWHGILRTGRASWHMRFAAVNGTGARLPA
jgi:hypothetical protein